LTTKPQFTQEIFGEGKPGHCTLTHCKEGKTERETKKQSALPQKGKRGEADMPRITEKKKKRTTCLTKWSKNGVGRKKKTASNSTVVDPGN